MRINKLFLRWIAVFGMVMAFVVSGWGADQCTGTAVSKSFTTNGETYSDSGSLAKNAIKKYYFSVPPGGGTITLTLNNANSSDIRYYYDLTNCLGSGTQLSFHDGDQITLTSDVDFNLIIYHTKNSARTFDFTLTYNRNYASAVDDSTSINQSTSLAYSVLTNDSGDGIRVTTWGTPSHGTFDWTSSDGWFSYTPTGTYIGNDSFTYTITDQYGHTSNATVNITVVDPTLTNANFRDFSKRTSFFAQGDLISIGNTFTVAPYNDATTANCSTYTNGTYYDPISSNNADRRYCHFNVDGVQGSAATRAKLTIPSGSRIKWAGLYWQALTPHRASYANLPIQIRRDESSSTYQSVTATHVDYQPNYSNNITPVGSSTGATTADLYSAFADVTTLFQSQGWLDGNYTVKTADVLEGRESYFGVYGAWNLIVIYENDSDAYTYKSFTVFDGWKRVQSGAPDNDVSVYISGFYTPRVTPINARVTVFAAEGDYNIDGDKLKALRKSDGTLVEFLNSNNPSATNQTFSSYVNTTGARSPSQANNNGIDIQTFDIGSTTTYNLLQTEQTDMTFHFTSTSDLYFPSVLAFATEIYMPKLCYDYSYKQDGAYLPSKNDGTKLPYLEGNLNDSEIEVSIYLRNKEADLAVQGVSFHTDLNTTVFNYVNGSTGTTNTNGSAYITRTDSSTGSCSYDSTSTSTVACNDGHNVRIGLGNGATGYGETTAGNLGSQEFVYAKFSLNPSWSGIQDTNESLGLKLNYYVQPNSTTTLKYDYLFGSSKLQLCPPSTGYNPVWGTFNVVDHYASSTLNGLPFNNLRTQVSRKPFAVDVATYEKDTTSGKYTKKPTIDMNTTVLVEVIDNDAFHDANASCANPGSVITEPIYVRVDHTSTDMTIDIPVQSLSYHNFAVKNAAYRVWYFDDQDKSLINWTAATSDTTRRKLTNISGLYRSTYHTVCSTACSSPTSTTCFNCIKTNYARPLCSRDNFAVRPESYDLRIYDVNQTLPKNSTLKDATKIDLSNQYQYAPMYTSPTGRMNLAAGYNYRYDMNATGNDVNLTNVPGYTRYFNGANGDYNATMIWNPRSGKVVSGCNDTSSKNLSFYVGNGRMLNSEQNQTQVGDYQLNVIDPSWTAVDWKNSALAHHTTANGFEEIKMDCMMGSDSTSSVNGKIGCTTTSAHSGGGYTYKDHLLTLKPSMFNVEATYRLGRSGTISKGGKKYIYDSNLSRSDDINMSVRSYSPIKAVGYGEETLSNFVKDCYATDLNISIKHDANFIDRFVGRMQVSEINGTQIYDSLEFNVTKPTMIQVIDDTYFRKAGLGETIPTIYLNYDRNVRVPINPHTVQYFDLNVSCYAVSDCNMSAMSNHTPNIAIGSDLMDFNVTHVYGRLATRDVRVFGNLDFTANAWYEVFNTPNLLETALVPNRMESQWYVNSLHNDDNDGNSNVNVVLPNTLALPANSNMVNPPNDGMETYSFGGINPTYSGKAHINTEGWLWFGRNAGEYLDPVNATNLDCQTHPCFNINISPNVGHAGSASKVDLRGEKDNKSTSTDTGVTYDYTPATR